MKYIKLFENPRGYTEPVEIYWQISTRRRYLRVALKKIGMNPDEIEYWYRILVQFDNEHIGLDVYIFRKKAVTYNTKTGKYDPAGYSWSYSTLEFNKISPNSKFMGKVKVTELELDADKYNL